MRRFLVLVFAVVGSVAFAQDIRDKVVSPPSRPKASETIDPDTNIYGIPYGLTEDQFIAQYGSPIGYLRLSGSESGMIYGMKHCFLFTSGKLSGVRITHGIVDWKLIKSMSPFTPFDQVKWRLSNGIGCDMNLVEVRKILGDRLMTQGFQRSFETERMRVDLEFSHVMSEGDKDEAYKLFGLLITPK